MNTGIPLPSAAPLRTEPGMGPGAKTAPAHAVDSLNLLQGQRELLIHHQGQLYRLQATRQGKLILTK